MNNNCPVCGYKHAPEEHSICPCCGTEFGYDDFSVSHEELRNRWLANGAPWFSAHTQPLHGHWDINHVFIQLYKSGLLKAELKNSGSAFKVSQSSSAEEEDHNFEVVA